MNQYVHVNHIRLHYLDRPGGEPPLLLLPGLTANAHSLDGLAARLSPRFRTLAVDFRGRGLSDKPETGYGMADYAADVLGLLDALGLETAVPVGHSFGALVGLILAARHPARVPALVFLDSSHLLITERTVQLVKASLDRLGQTLPSRDAYLAAMRQMPYLQGYWDADLESFYRHDVLENADGSVQTHTRPHVIAQTIDAEYAEPWLDHVRAVRQPVLLLNATAPYGPPGAPPILPEEMARETAALFANCTYHPIPGNHMTAIFGANADRIVHAVSWFLADVGFGMSDFGEGDG
ncbi:MAG: alpha/beta fold hydrolase [Anaerolineales bacterium]|nr:alpha/beta fold hydrolase [Anaerolineales bacterium]